MGMSTSDWADIIEAHRGATPPEFVLKFIDMESNGNPCATGSISGSFVREAGIGQVFFESPSSRTFGVSLGDLRAACVGTSQRQSRDLTESEITAQASSLCAQIHHFEDVARRQLDALDLADTWSQHDYYCLVKLQHALPGIPKSFLTPFAVGEFFGGVIPQDWPTWRAGLESADSAALTAIDRGTARYLPWGHYFNNAEKCASVLGDPVDVAQGLVGEELIVPAAIVAGAVAMGKFK